MAKKYELIGAVYPWNDAVMRLRRELDGLKGEDVQLDINSPGGLVSLGVEIYNRLDQYPGKITVNVIGTAASIATYIALAADTVNVLDNATWMIHNARGIAIGDYVTMRKYGEILDSMTQVLAKKYADKTGKSIEAIRKDMGAEKYFFGEGIKEYGFADNVIETGKKMDKKTTRATAEMEIQACFDDLKKFEASESDFNKIAAHVGGILSPPQPTAEIIVTDDKQEESIMDLKTAMAEHPGIKAEVNALVAEAKADGVKQGEESRDLRIKAAAPYIASSEYPDTITNLAVAVLKGEEPEASLKGAAVAFDAMAEKAKSEAAQAETDGQGETPGDASGGGAVSEGGMVATEAEYQASIAEAKKAQGIGGE